jgi:hypothetical protein
MLLRAAILFKMNKSAISLLRLGDSCSSIHRRYPQNSELLSVGVLVELRFLKTDITQT